MALPSKLFEALALGRPVLALTGAASDTARLLERLGQEAGIGAARRPGRDRRGDRAPARRPRRRPSTPRRFAEFDRDRIAARYAELLDEVATRSSSYTQLGHDRPRAGRLAANSRPASPSCRARAGSRSSASSASAAPSALPSLTIPATPSTWGSPQPGESTTGVPQASASSGGDRQPLARRKQREHVSRGERRPFSSSGISPAERHRLQFRARCRARSSSPCVLGAPITSSRASGSSARTRANASSSTSIRLIGCSWPR